MCMLAGLSPASHHPIWRSQLYVGALSVPPGMLEGLSCCILCIGSTVSMCEQHANRALMVFMAQKQAMGAAAGSMHGGVLIEGGLVLDPVPYLR